MPSNADFTALGVPPPRSTFLDKARRHGSPARPRAPVRPQSARVGGRAMPRSALSAIRTQSRGRTDDHRPASPVAATSTSSRDIRAALLAEHRAELGDMLQEAVASLRNVYRSKFTLGAEHLRHLDDNFGADGVSEFNLAEGPVFSPAAATAAASAGDVMEEPVAAPPASKASDERLRAAEELVKKLYQRNAQLELENQYLTTQVATVEQYQTVTGKRDVSIAASLAEGHVPLDHPAYTDEHRRRCRSNPPQRTLLRSAVEGEGLIFPPRLGEREAPVATDDPPAVVKLKAQVHDLTAGLVAAQHDNEVLLREREARFGLRDARLKRFLSEHDRHVAILHQTLQDVLGKIANPVKLTRARQPPPGVSAAVAANNVLREVAAKVSSQLEVLAGDVVQTAEQTVAPPLLDNARVDEVTGARRRDLHRRLKALADGLPVPKRKALLLLLTELKALFTAIAHSNQSAVEALGQQQQQHSQEVVKLKLQLSVAKDQLRACGIDTAALGV